MLSSASRGRWRHTDSWKVLFLILPRRGWSLLSPLLKWFAQVSLLHRWSKMWVCENMGGPPASAVATNQNTESPFELCRPDWGPVTSSAPCGRQALGTCASQGSPNTPWHLPWHPAPWQRPPMLQRLRGAGTSPHLWWPPAIFPSLTPFPLSLPTGPWTHQACSYLRQEIIPEISTWLLFSLSWNYYLKCHLSYGIYNCTYYPRQSSFSWRTTLLERVFLADIFYHSVF